MSFLLRGSFFLLILVLTDYVINVFYYCLHYSYGKIEAEKLGFHFFSVYGVTVLLKYKFLIEFDLRSFLFSSYSRIFLIFLLSSYFLVFWDGGDLVWFESKFICDTFMEAFILKSGSLQILLKHLTSLF